jgi:LuxR family maltose regulon positive regulatory protein
MFLIDSSTENAAARMELVVEKILMPQASPRISRPRLLSILEHSLANCASTVISGRAGSGKTCLATDFSVMSGRPSAWYKVDAPEAELRIFFQYLIASIQKHRPGFGVGTLDSLIEVAEPENIPRLAEAFVYELAEGDGTPLLIVIEDLHLVCDADWVVPFFRRLLPLLPSEVHLLITSRTLPPAPLWRMRSKQTLLVITEETLAFTRLEAGELFESYGLSTEQANIAVDHTHGRAAALASFAAALSANKREPTTIAANAAN